MPYIKDEQKQALDKGMDALNAGELTYIFQSEIKRYLQHHGLRYQQIAEVLGSLEGARLDFIDRVVKKYEEDKALLNGDVWPTDLIEGSKNGG